MQLGPIVLGEEIPHIVAIVERLLSPEELVGVRRNGATALEFRVDAFPEDPQLLDRLEEDSRRPDLADFALIGTVRENDANRDRRLAIFERLLDFVHCIDVEFESPLRQSLIDTARSKERLVIVSVHDFERTPSRSELEAIVGESRDLGADIIKLAVFAGSRVDLLDLLAFTRECDFPQLVTIAMGPEGLLSRIAAPFSGSVLTYGFLDQPNAPGQLSAAKLHEELLLYHPRYRAEYEARMGTGPRE